MIKDIHLTSEYVHNRVFSNGYVRLYHKDGTSCIIPLIRDVLIRENEATLESCLRENNQRFYCRYRIHIEDGRYGLCAVPDKNCVVYHPATVVNRADYDHQYRQDLH